MASNATAMYCIELYCLSKTMTCEKLDVNSALYIGREIST